MTNCTRDTAITDWDGPEDAARAWRTCGCYVCTDALEELPEQLQRDPLQTTL